jgi:hypothetical protein
MGRYFAELSEIVVRNIRCSISYKKNSTGSIERRTEMFVWDLDSESRLKNT